MATRTWTGVFGGNWSDASGWSGGSVPASGDTVLINQDLEGPYTVHIDSNEGAYAALTVSSKNSMLVFDTGGVTLSVSGLTTLSGGGISIAGNAALSTGTFSEIGGFLGMSNGALAANGEATLSGGGMAFYGGAFNAGSLKVSGGSIGMSGGTATVAGQVTVSGGSASFYGGAFNAASLSISGGSIGMSGGTLASSGALTLSGTGSIGVYNNAAQLQAASLTVSGGTIGMSGGTLTVTGPARFTGGTDVFYAGSTFDAGSLQLGSNGGNPQSVTVNGAAVSVSGLTTISSASTAGGSTLSMYGGSLAAVGGINDLGTLIGAGTVSGGTINSTGIIEAARGTLDISNTIASGPTLMVASGGDLKIDGTATAAQPLNLIDGAQTLEIGSQGALTIQGLERDTAGTIRLEGGSLTDSGGFQTGSNVIITGFGTINADLLGFGLHGAALHAAGGTLAINGNVSSSVLPDIVSEAVLSLQSTVDLGTSVKFLSSDSGTLRLANATARQSFETDGTMANMNVNTAGTFPTDTLDLADLQPSSITSATIANGNTIELFNGATMLDRFALASSPGAAKVHWVSDGAGGTNVFLSTT